MFFRKEFDSEQERSDCTQERRCRLLEKPTAHSLAGSRFAPVLNRARFPQILVAAEPGYVICGYSHVSLNRSQFNTPRSFQLTTDLSHALLYFPSRFVGIAPSEAVSALPQPQTLQKYCNRSALKLPSNPYA